MFGCGTFGFVLVCWFLLLHDSSLVGFWLVLVLGGFRLLWFEVCLVLFVFWSLFQVLLFWVCVWFLVFLLVTGCFGYVWFVALQLLDFIVIFLVGFFGLLCLDLIDRFVCLCFCLEWFLVLVLCLVVGFVLLLLFDFRVGVLCFILCWL